MHSNKEYEAKIRQLNKKIKKLEDRLSDCRKKNTALRKRIKYLRRRIRELIASRDKWKEKNKDKSQKIKGLKDKEKRREEKAGRHQYPIWLVSLCVLLRIRGNCSYASVVKVLKILNVYLHLNLNRIPCANTVQNWVSKMGLNQLENAACDWQGEEVSIITDECIRLGQEKLLVVLICPFNKQGKEALGFSDVKVGYMKGAVSWKGTDISKEIEEHILNQGMKVINILSDEGSNLTKAAELLQLSHVPDIGHAIATCLRQTFEKDPDYQLFIKRVAACLSKGVNQELSYLIPPKLGKKARFMNQGRTVDWSEIILNNWEKLNEKERSFFGQIKDCQPIIQVLGNCIKIAKIVGSIFKKKGLSTETLLEVRQELEKFKESKGLVEVFLSKIESYLCEYELFISKYPNGYCIHVSSDIIESMFGKYKNKANNYALTGLTKLNLELPLYCMEDEEIILQTKLALEGVFMTDLGEWVKNQSPDSQLIRRLRFLKMVG